MTWNPQLYAAFADERLRPALDLIGRIRLEAPRAVVDLGCGTGNVTCLLRERWPEARVTAIDSSEAMLAKAPLEIGIEWRLADLREWRPEAPVDLVFSNAALHWLDGHRDLFQRLAEAVAPGGVLAVQMPNNWREPSHTIAAEIADSRPWRDAVVPLLRSAPLLTAGDYYEILAGPARSVDVWETQYFHVLEGEDPVLRWTSGTLLAPLLSALDDVAAADFDARYRERLRQAYPRRLDGRTLFPFRRLFIVAQF